MFQEPEKKELYRYKLWNNSKWWWCGDKTRGKCNQHRQHKGKDCRGGTKPSNDDTSKTSNPTKRKVSSKNKTKIPPKVKDEPNSTKKLKLSKALVKQANVIDNDEDDVSIGSSWLLGWMWYYHIHSFIALTFNLILQHIHNPLKIN